MDMLASADMQTSDLQASADVQRVPIVIPRRPALHGAADFVSWTWEMVNAGYDDIGWSTDGSRISIKKPDRLASLILPQFFRHSQYASWVRALNAYHFKKVATGQWQHPCFHRDRPELLKKIVRKPREPASRPAQSSSGGGGLSSSTALDLRVVGSHVGAVLAEERSRLWWLKQEMRRLEGEVQEAEREELRQRWEAVALTQYIFEQMKLRPRDAQEPRLAGGLLAGGLLAGGSMQERGGPAITMLSSAMMEEGLPTATAMEEGGAHLRRGGATSMATSMATSEHSGAARGGSAAPASAGPQTPGQPPGPSRISSRDLAQLDLSEIELLAQGIDLRELERSLGSPRSRGLGSPRSFSSPASAGHPPLPLPSLMLSPSISPHATQPPRISREGPSSLSVGGVGSMGSVGGVGSVGTLELSAGSGAHTAMRQHGAHLDAAPAAAGSAAGGLQKAAVDYYFNQLSLMAEHGLQEQGLH